MKIKRLFFILLSVLVLFNACKFLDFDGETGLVVVKLGSSSANSRALNADDLPFIEDTDIKIIAINKSTGEKIERSVGGGSDPSIFLPIGESYIIRVKLYNELGIWMGENEHTVSNGANEVNVEITRKASGFRNIGFSMWKDNSDKTMPIYKYSLNLDSQIVGYSDDDDFTVPPTLTGGAGMPPIFCRDLKGFLYVAGQEQLHIYKSDGETLSGWNALKINSLACDNVSGDVYAVMNEPNFPLKKLNYGNAPDPIMDFSAASFLAVHDGIAFGVQAGSSWFNSIQTADLDSASPSLSPVNVVGLVGTLASEYGFTWGTQKVYDVFVDDDALYVLFDKGENPADAKKLYGGILKLRYTVNTSSSRTVVFTDAELIGLGNLADFSSDSILPESYYYNHFYRPVKFIGRDGDVLYIADDGVLFKNKLGKIITVANKNRVAKFNLKNASLNFIEGESKNTWLSERTDLYKTPKRTGLFLWDLYELKFTDMVLGEDPLVLEQTTEAPPSPLPPMGTDVFSYGKLTIYNSDPSDVYSVSNFYWLNYRLSTNPSNPIREALIEKYVINSHYDHYDKGEPLILPSSAITDPQKIKAISVDEENKILYCATNEEIHKFTWTSNFDDGAYDAALSIPINANEQITAIASSGEFLYVASEINTLGMTATYSLIVKKYSKDDFSTVFATWDIVSNEDSVSEGTTRTNIREQLSDIQIVNDRVYVISTKEFNGGSGATASLKCTGKLLELTIDGVTPVINTRWSGDDVTKGYAPYRFIAKKEDELVVASDGCYATNGYPWPEEKNKILIFDLDGSLKEEVSTEFPFSRETIFNGSNYSWR